MSVNLNEFTADQLEYAIGMFKERENDLNYKISSLDIWPDGELKEETLKALNKAFDTCILFKIQLMNALQEVKDMDKTLSQ